jgi:hypothetical protein
MVPEVVLGLRYETNPDYLSNSDLEDDAYAGVLDTRLRITGDGNRGRIDLQPRIQASVYTGAENDSRFDTVNYYLPVSGLWVDRRAQYSVTAGYSDISTRESEIRVVDPNDPGQPGSSGRIVTVDEDQERWYLRPAIDFQVTQRDIFGVTLHLEDVTYTEAEFTNRSNYEYGSLGASWTRAISAKSKVSSGVSVDGFRASPPGSPIENETVTYGFNIGYQYAWSDITTLGATVGASRSDISVTGLPFIDHDENPTTPPLPCFDPIQRIIVPCELKTDDDNFVGEVFLQQKTTDTITTELRISRAIQPNSDGAQVTHDLVRGYISKALSPQLNASIGATYIRQDAVGKQTAGLFTRRLERDFVRAEANLSWRLSRQWSIGAGYYFTSDEQTGGISISTDNHVVNLQLRYKGLGSH